jgi:muramoyltetrapeptide carboxypeptidase
MAGDIRREGGEACVLRALSYLTSGDQTGLEPTLNGRPTLAYNMAVLSSVLGTPIEPPMQGHVLMLEEVSEYMYRTDRFLFQITSTPSVRTVAGIRLGRVSDVPSNDPDFLLGEEEVMRHWCQVAGIPYLGRADIGHDVDNKIVPFGATPQS